MSIRDWPEDARPREKMLEYGAACLTDAELLAVFLRVGVTGYSAVDLGRELLNRFGSLHGLCSASATQFCEIKGMGLAKYALFQAVMELTKRIAEESISTQPLFDNSATVGQYLRGKIGTYPYEVFGVILLNTTHHFIAFKELFRGTLTQTTVYPREVARHAIECNAASVILAHNHPSGYCYPSAADSCMTQTLKQALGLLDIAVLDHFIVNRTESYSFADNGLMDLDHLIQAS